MREREREKKKTVLGKNKTRGKLNYTRVNEIRFSLDPGRGRGGVFVEPCG